MKFVVLFGPQAVGKMTVGEALEETTGLKLFHNHMTIELVHRFFDFDTAPFRRLVDLFRFEILEEVAKSDLDGLIFTYVWAFDLQEDWDFVEQICRIFETKGGEVYFVELEADVKERLRRNQTPHRLEQKPTKRNVRQSERNLKESLKQHRLNSEPGEVSRENSIRINNTNLSPREVAAVIKKEFHLQEK